MASGTPHWSGLWVKSSATGSCSPKLLVPPGPVALELQPESLYRPTMPCCEDKLRGKRDGSKRARRRRFVAITSGHQNET